MHSTSTEVEKTYNDYSIQRMPGYECYPTLKHNLYSQLFSNIVLNITRRGFSLGRAVIRTQKSCIQGKHLTK